MNWNKCFGYFIVINIIALLFSYVTDPPINGWPIFVAIILVNTVFGIFCRGWQRVLAILFVTAGLIAFTRAIEWQETINTRLKRIQKAGEDYGKTNNRVVTPP